MSDHQQLSESPVRTRRALTGSKRSRDSVDSNGTGDETTSTEYRRSDSTRRAAEVSHGGSLTDLERGSDHHSSNKQLDTITSHDVAQHVLAHDENRRGSKKGTDDSHRTGSKKFDSQHVHASGSTKSHSIHDDDHRRGSKRDDHADRRCSKKSMDDHHDNRRASKKSQMAEDHQRRASTKQREHGESSRATRMRNRMKAMYEEVMFERRILFGCTLAVGLSIIIWLVAISTDYWFTISAPTTTGVYINETRRYFLFSHSGLWKICRTSYVNASSEQHYSRLTKCRYHEFFPGEHKIGIDPTVDDNSLNYSRTEVSFAIISLCLMIMGFSFSIYTFRNPRYMFKRLAGGIHFITGASVLVVIEVLLSSIDYERVHLPFVHPRGSVVGYGYSIVLAWLVFVTVMVSGCAFMLYSRKRKGNKAPTDEIAMADEPTIIGR